MISSFSIDKADYEPRRSSRSSNVNYHLSNEDDDSNDDGENSSDAGYSEELSEKSEEDDDDDEDWGANTKPKKIKLIKKKMLSKKNSTRKRRRQISSSSESAQSVVFSDIDLSQDSNDEDEGNSMRRQNSLFDIDDEDDDDDDDDDDDNDYVRKRQRTKIKHTVTRMSERRVKRKNYAEPSEVDQDLMISDEEEYIMQPSPTPDDDSIEAIEKILNVRNEDNDVCEYEVKWKNRAYLHTSWHTAEYLAQVKGFRILHNFQRAQDAYKKALIHCSPEEIEQVNITREMNAQRRLRFVIVDRIIAMRHNENDECEYMTKWLDLGYDCSTWETAETLQPFQKHIDDFLERERSGTKPRTHNNAYRKLKKQPEWMTAGVLRDYQLEGLNWLLFSEREKRNVILADEMGLGKTIQCISLIASLYTDYAHFGPYLVVVPLSTIAAWKRELQKWAPWMHVIEYRGNPSARAICRQYEWYRDGIARKRIAKFQVMLTNYEVVNKDKDLLSVFKWKYLIVDEAHRLKDNQSLLYTTLCGLKTTNRLLVTGTPLQNSLKELWCLLHFLEPKTFFSLDDFTERYGEIAQGGKQASNISSLHELLAPYLLRRTKKDVLKSLPAKTERILRVSMSALQRQYYRWVLSRNFNELNRGLKGSSSSSLSNTIMELKKVCNHPYLFANAESHGHSPEETVRQLILNSGKLELLDKLLLRLKENGHRVLIFSQMVRMLDILADYMTMRGFQYQRLDGSMNSESRQFSMDHFNADNSADFCFLLSTRAGGLGVNLATADTVVIFDSDWNPQNDLQAEARAHRIGQKKTVNIYRLVTKNSVEEDILERAKRKMILDHLVIQKMDTSGRGVLFEGEAARKQFDKRELMKIVQFGARALFKEEHASASGPGEVSNTVASTVSAKQNDVDLDDILARAETKLDQSNGPTNDTDEFLSAFKVANFVGDSSSTMAEDEEDSGTKQDDQFWQRVIPEHLRPVSEHDQDLVGIFMPRRARTAVKSYNEARIIDQNAHENDGNDFSDNEKDTSVSRQRRKKVPHSRASPARDSKQCYRALLQYGAIDVAVDFLLNGSMKGRTRKLLEDCMRDILQAVTNSSAISSKGTKVADSAEHKKDKGKLTKSKARLVVHGTVIDAAVLQQRITDMKILRDEIGDAREHYRVTVGVPPVRWKCPWGVRKDSLLLVGILQHGFGSWTQIFADKRLGLGSVIFKDGKQRVSNTQLLTRSRLLLRKLGQKHAKFSKTPSVFKMQSMKHKTSSDNHSLNPDKRSFNSALSPIKKQSQSKAMIKQPQENQSSMVVAKKTDVDVAALHDWCRESLMQRLEAMRAIKKLRLKLKESQGLDATPRDSKRYLLRIGDFITQTGDDAVCPHADAENVEREMWSITANLLDVEATLLSDLYWDVANVEDEVGIVKLFTTFAERRRPTIVKNVNDDR